MTPERDTGGAGERRRRPGRDIGPPLLVAGQLIQPLGTGDHRQDRDAHDNEHRDAIGVDRPTHPPDGVALAPTRYDWRT